MKFRTQLLMLLIALGCSEEHVNDTLVIKVVDGSGAPVANATVRLYASEDDYKNDVVKESFTSGAQGTISSKSPAYASGTFLAEAEKDGQRNWPATTVKGGTNDYKLVLADNNVYNELVGIHWNLVDVTIGGTSVFSSVSDCSKDNFLLFRKDQMVVFDESTNVCVGNATVEETFVPPIKGDNSNSVIYNSVTFYTLSLNAGGEGPPLGFLFLSHSLTVVLLVNGSGSSQVVNTYMKL